MRIFVGPGFMVQYLILKKHHLKLTYIGMGEGGELIKISKL